jgi:hypothetical protein
MKPITKDMQKANRLALADHLENNVTDEQYFQYTYVRSSTGARCAFGHAAAIGMCGLILYEGRIPLHPEMHDITDSLFTTISRSARHFFGDHINSRVFVNFSILNRQQAINALRHYKDKPAYLE